MLMLLAAALGQPPAFTVTDNRAAFTVVDNRPAPARAPNGFNCGAGFCRANGGGGCPSCPNQYGGVCICGSAPAVAAPDPVIRYVLPSYSGSSCPGGVCPVPTRRGLFGRRN
jgi:hypothetical protein